MWMCINDGIIGASSSIRAYSYLVKKVVFPVDIIPIISLISNAFVALFLFVIATVTCIAFHFIPNVLQVIYIIFSAYAFIIAFTRFTSAVATLVPDFTNLLGIIMQLCFWFTTCCMEFISNCITSNHYKNNKSNAIYLFSNWAKRCIYE